MSRREKPKGAQNYAFFTVIYFTFRSSFPLFFLPELPAKNCLTTTFA